MSVPEMPSHKRVEVFFDGECPLCMREIQLLRFLDRRGGHIAFTDIAAPDFDAAAYDRTQAQFMGSIQGRDERGQWIEGVEVFRQLYSAVGMGWLVAVTRLPGVTQLLDVLYGVFARNRLRLTGRPEPRCTTDRCMVGTTVEFGVSEPPA